MLRLSKRSAARAAAHPASTPCAADLQQAATDESPLSLQGRDCVVWLGYVDSAHAVHFSTKPIKLVNVALTCGIGRGRHQIERDGRGGSDRLLHVQTLQGVGWMTPSCPEGVQKGGGASPIPLHFSSASASAACGWRRQRAEDLQGGRVEPGRSWLHKYYNSHCADKL